MAGAFNAVSVYADHSGHTMYYGRGAGGPPTAAAVVGDVAAVALGSAQRRFESLGVWPDRAEPAQQLHIDAVESRYYLRIQAADRPGTLGTIANVLGDRGISIFSVLQHEAVGDVDIEGVPVVITTHPAKEGSLTAALAVINNHPTVKSPCVCIRMVDEHPERVE